MKKVNRKWFKNRLKAGLLEVKCTGIYSDDYAYDNEVNFHRQDRFEKAPADLFQDWVLNAIHIYESTEAGIINVSFASCEYYEFRLAEK
jgi:hypothetical protein